MPRYFFQLNEGNDVTEDIDGSELPDLEAARHYAVRAARELLAHAILWDRALPPESIAVLDEDGRILLTVFTAEVLPDHIKKRIR